MHARNFLFTLVLFSSSLTRADIWVCEGRDGGLGHFKVEMDLSLPDVTVVDGQTRVNLISTSTVSSGHISVNECQSAACGYEDQQNTLFRCEYNCPGYRRGGANSGAGGTLQVDLKVGRGEYFENFYGTQKTITLENCRAQSH